MKTIDFLKPGGFPVTLETLDFMQQAYNPALLAGFSDAGNTPVILSGMLPDVLQTTLSPGWCIIGGELLYCAGGALKNGFAPFVVPQTVVGAVEFQEGNLEDVYFTKTAVLLSNTDSITIGSVYLSDFQHWTAGMIANVRTRIETLTVAFGPLAGGTNGSYTLRKDPWTGLVNLKGTFTAASPSSISLDAPYYGVDSGFPAQYRPLDNVPFSALIRHHSYTPPTESTGKDYIRQINCTVSDSGYVSLGLLRAASSYTASFNITYPTW